MLREWPLFIRDTPEAGMIAGSGSSKLVSRICPTLRERFLFKVSLEGPSPSKLVSKGLGVALSEMGGEGGGEGGGSKGRA